jgi:HicB family
MTMSRPKVYNEPRVATAIRLPSSLHGELQTAATARDVSVNFLVTRAVSAFLAQLPPPGEDLPSDAQAPS